MADIFQNFVPGLESPACHGMGVTPDDGTDLPLVSRALNVAGEGTLRVTTLSGDDIKISIAAGIPFPIRVTRIWATGTTATGIVALY